MQHFSRKVTGRRLATAAAGLSVIAGARSAIAAPIGGSFEPWQSDLIGQPGLDSYCFASDFVLGTSMDLVLRTSSREEAAQCHQQMLDEIERLSGILSTYDPSSEISRVMSGGSVESRELSEVLDAYELWNQRTCGAIDVNMGEVIRLWKHADKIPGDAELRAAYEQPRAWNVDALGKGYIIDRAVEVARKIAPAGMLNIGGDIRVWGDSQWPIGVADPINPADNAQLLTQFDLRNAAVATSADYSRVRVIDGRRYSHIIDPRTLRPVESDVSGATIVVSDALSANAISTAAMVLGTDKGTNLARQFSEDFLLTGQNGSQSGSGALAGSTVRKLDTAESATAWPTGYEVKINLSIKSPNGGRAKRPYVVVYIKNSNSDLVRTLSLWGNESRYLPELSFWWKTIGNGRNFVRSVTRATRPPGQYTLTWDGTDDHGKAVPRGSYAIILEVAREHGGHVKESHLLDCNDKPNSGTIAATSESGESKVEYGPRSQ